jgi:hypothetical protein
MVSTMLAKDGRSAGLLQKNYQASEMNLCYKMCIERMKFTRQWKHKAFNTKYKRKP